MAGTDLLEEKVRVVPAGESQMQHPAGQLRRRVGGIVRPVHIYDLGLFYDPYQLLYLSQVKIFRHVRYHGEVIPDDLENRLIFSVFPPGRGLPPRRGHFPVSSLRPLLLPLFPPHGPLKGRPALIPCCLQHADNGGLPHAGPVCQFPHSHVPGRLRVLQKQIRRFFLVPAQHGIAEPQFILPHIRHSLVRSSIQPETHRHRGSFDRHHRR